ncbi:MAG: dockerin type I domain-containing protein [Ruminococcus sp.]|nr:dockerin type I domain-containing protein [Oscillospiraceae bacterium]MDY4414108.1 dockerin type I domain-containing protein [Ruminococcus sp.]
MKLKKMASGLVSVLVLSCSALSVMSASGAEGTVKISASQETAFAGGQFTVEVSLSDIPETGIQGADFAVAYDSSIVSIDKVEIGSLAQTGADEVDNIPELPAFMSSISKEKSAVLVSFAVADSDSKYYMQGEGVMFTITGTVLENAPDGSVAEFNIVPNPRKINGSGTAEDNNKIWLGYDADTNPDDDVTNYIYYDSSVSNGSVTVSGGASDGLRGDANLDGSVDIADVVAIASYVSDSVQNPLKSQGMINADVQGEGNGINANDALAVQQYLANIITVL